MIISPGSTARWCWSMRSRRSTPGPTRCVTLKARSLAILDCFRIGRRTLLSQLFRPRIDRILFAATKADHLHHSTMIAWRRSCGAWSSARRRAPRWRAPTIDVIALAAVRATREAQVRRGREKLPSIIGTPAAGETADGEKFDGETEVATFPGDLPADPEALFRAAAAFAASPRSRPTRPIFGFCACARPTSRRR